MRIVDCEVKTKNPLSAFSLRGGRLRKSSRGVVSYAPFLTGAVSAVALGSVLALSMPSFAQASVNHTTATTTVETTGTVAAGSDSVTKRGDVHTVTSTATAPTKPGTAITVSGNISDEYIGVDVSRSGDGDFSFTNSATIGDVDYGIDITRGGTGDFDIVNNGAITDVLEDGIYATRSGSGRLKINTTGNISAEGRGINATHSGTGNFEITGSGAITGGSIGIRAAHTGTSGNIKITGDSGFSIDDVGIGVYAKHTGDGNINITARGGSSITSQREGIIAKQTGNGRVSIITEGTSSINAGFEGVFVKQTSSGNAANHNGIYARLWGGDITSSSTGAVVIDQDATSNNASVTVRTQGNDITGRNGSGISIDSSSTGTNNGVHVQVDGGRVSGSGNGIRVHHTGGGSVSIQLYGGVQSSNPSNNAIEMESGGDKKLSLERGFSLGRTDGNGNKTGGKVVARGSGEATLSLGATFADFASVSGLGARPYPESLLRTQALVLDFGKEQFEGFGTFLKIDADPWEVRGVADSTHEAFSTASLDKGVLRFRNATFRMSGRRPFKINPEAVLEIHGSNRLAGHLRNGGTVAFASAGANDTLEVEENYRGTGNLVFHVGDSGWDSDKFTIKGSTRARGAEWDVSVESPDVVLPAFASSTPPVLIEVEGDAHVDDFESEEITLGARKYDLVHATVNGNHTWSFRDVGPAQTTPSLSHVPRTASRVSRREPIVSSEPGDGGSSGSELGFLAGTRKNAGGVWAQLQSSRTSLQPNAITDSSSRVEDERVYFGYDTPAMSFMGGDMVVGGSVWQGFTTSDVSSPIGDGDIGVESDAVALTASWRSHDGFYADGDVQYTRFSTDVSAEVLAERVSLVQDNEGSGVSASAAAGYRFAIPFGAMDFSVVPQMQMVWSSVGFDDFVGPHGELVSLEDGDLVTGRLGLSWDGEWQDLGGSGRIYGGVNLHDALDGRTSVNVSGFSFASKEGFSVDGRLGLSYEWDDGYSVYGEAMALRQGDAEEVRANLGMGIDF